MKTQSRKSLLTHLENRVEAHLRTVTASFQNLSEEQLLKPSTSGGWSIAQCLEHLNSYGRYYLPAIEQRIQAAKDSISPDFKSSWLGAYFTRLMEPGKKSKAMKAPKEHVPPVHLDSAKVLAEFIDQQEMLLRLLHAAADKDLNQIRVPISIAKFIRLKLGDVFGFLVAHNERHIQQALRNLNA
ncbi:MAG: DinB family protein [Chitinophagaceae bacterium]|nr:MAG: DinB family protein [Chitinophagaceae bacterium]